MRFLTWAQLHERGILPSRQHTRRLIERGIIPKPYRLGDPERGRLTWLEADIEAYVATKLAERDSPRRRPADRADGHNIVPLRRGRRRSPSGDAHVSNARQDGGERLNGLIDPPLEIIAAPPEPRPGPIILRRPVI